MNKKKQTIKKPNRYLLLGALSALLIVSAFFAYPFLRHAMGEKEMVTQSISQSKTLGLDSKSPREYYDMFQCPCCGQPVDTGCCGMAKQRKEHLDGLLLEGVQDTEVAVQMVKKFGFGTLMDPAQEKEIKEYLVSKAPDNPPKIAVESPRYDFGTISQSQGIVSTSFKITNTGESDLIIDSLDTSCMCTTAKLVYKGEESPEFGMSMHGTNPKNFELRIPPGDSTELKVFYDPMAHGKQKKPEMRIVREVTITSNDPVDFQKGVRIELTQVR
ncbi:DUF1573 domain-containing protein [Candidatus Woesearchaeota archaeon]|nr:DUF1573 domain-containing protein [Candidatus Woesearchaeota archaeon]